ncbi:ABC transporter ATP-binding protein [Acidimicrobiales bacterium]|nr:ABC transporter ATP-binding protein [bacterium]MDC1389351.1 ABC transporter ATP-binding protein [Acidimicrobiales bacterium]
MTTNKVPDEVSAPVRPVALVVDDVHVQYDAYLAGSNDRSLKRFVTGQRTRATINALSGISFTLRQGDSLGVLGHNGSGKSTLLGAMAGQVPCTSGRVLVRSQPKMLSSATSAMNIRLSGRDNITLGLLSIGLKPAEVAAKEAEVVDYTELGDFIDMPVTTYSSGMRARLLFAIKTHQTPDILLLDEALSVGDKSFKKKSLARINEIRASAGVVVMATHQPNEIRESCSHAMWLKDGLEMRFGEPEEVIEEYESAGGSRRNTVERRGRHINRHRTDDLRHDSR